MVARQAQWVPKWLRPGGRGARAGWVASLVLAAFLIGIGWAQFMNVIVRILWTVAIVAIEVHNFRTLCLGRGRQADSMRRAIG
jgi:hypothetical protein